MDQPDGNNHPAVEEQVPTAEHAISRVPRLPPPEVEKEYPALLKEEENDSFDVTVAIVPRSQQLARNTIRPTPYNDVADILTIPLHKFHDYVLKYINVIGQVVSVFRTTKGSVVIRIWDGTAHKFVHNTHLFFTDDAWIEHYYSQPMMQFQDLPNDYFADIVIYGEFIHVAENLRSGDMIHLVNVHMYRPKSQRQITPVVHENGQMYHRHIVLLDEEEQIIVDKKSLLVEKLEYVKANLNGGNMNMSRMAGFLNRPSAQVRPLQQHSPRASTIPGASNSVGMMPELQTTRQVLMERSASESNEGGQKRCAVKDGVEPIEQPPKKTPKLMLTKQKEVPAPADPSLLPSSLANPHAPPREDDRTAESPTAVPTVHKQLEKVADPLSPRSETALRLYLNSYFQNKIHSMSSVVDYVLPSTSDVRANQSIYDFLNRKPTLVCCSAQTSPQPSPVKRSNKAVQANVKPVRPATRNSSAQRTPVKTRNVDCNTESAKTRVAQTSPARAPTTNEAGSPPIASLYGSLHQRIKQEPATSPLLKSPPAPRPPPRADSLIRNMIPIRETTRMAVKWEDPPPTVPLHKKKPRTESPQALVDKKPIVDAIELKPLFYTQPQQKIFAKPKDPAKRAGEKQKSAFQSSPAQNFRVRPAGDSSTPSVSSRTRNAKKRPVVNERRCPSKYEEQPEQKPGRLVVVNRSFLEPQVQSSWSQQANVAADRRSTRDGSNNTFDVQHIKSER